MSDFDAVLERLLTDPSFAAALAADPATALAGYRLDPDEVALLHSQVTGDLGGQAAVETRANQSSVFGLLAPLSGLAGGAGSLDGGATGQGFGAASEHGGHAGRAGFGGAPGAREGFGAVSGAGEGFGAAAYQDGAGTAADPGPAVAEPSAVKPPEGYRIRVDADGDGSWDRHTLRGGPDGVDILVDTDSDGRVDFIGHDRDADGLVDSARYDEDGDGFFEKRSYDRDGDGLLDRSETRQPPRQTGPPAGGGPIGRNVSLPEGG